MSTSTERMRSLRERQRQEGEQQQFEDEYVHRELAITRATFGDEPERLERSELTHVLEAA
jgi:hypothetical protein